MENTNTVNSTEKKEEIVSQKKKKKSKNPGAEKKGMNKGFLIALIILLVVGGWYGYNAYKHSLSHEETDDAKVVSNISAVISRIGGYIKEVRVKDNQYVQKGDTLVILDDRDLNINVQQAEAALATAKSNLNAAQATTNASKSNITASSAGINTINAQIEAAKVNVWRTQQDFARYENLYNDHSITKQQYEQALAAKQTAEKQLLVLDEQKKQVQQQTNSVASQSGATSQQINIAASVIKQREVDLANAKLNKSYTVITAQASGRVSSINLQEGQLVQAAQPLFSIVLSNDVWVIANFKETQFEKMREGQKVTVTVDAFPDHKFDATLTSFSPATGASFSLLPADNASGNFVKKVQRIPVKIEFNKSDSLVKNLRAGMSVLADVHVK